jgi:hypothetical protein
MPPALGAGIAIVGLLAADLKGDTGEEQRCLEAAEEQAEEANRWATQAAEARAQERHTQEKTEQRTTKLTKTKKSECQRTEGANQKFKKEQELGIL